MKSNQKWYPVSVTIGRPVDTDTVAKKLADLSSLSVGDVLSVLKLLGGVIGDYMNNGRSVKLDGVGNFYYTANAEGQGVDTADEVGAQQITGTRVRFIPETTRDSSNKVTTRSLVSSDVFWELLDDEIPARAVPDGEDSDDGEEELPLGGGLPPGPFPWDKGGWQEKQTSGKAASPENRVRYRYPVLHGMNMAVTSSPGTGKRTGIYSGIKLPCCINEKRLSRRDSL